MRAPAVLLIVALATQTAKAHAPSSASSAEATRLFRESAALYKLGRFAETVQLLKRAYALQPTPVLLYNLGRAYEGLGDLSSAIEAYRRYLEGDPGAPDRLAIEVRINTLEQNLEEKRRLEAARQEALARAEAEAQRRRAAELNRRYAAAPWAIAGAGALGLIVGGGLGGGMLAERSDAPSAASQAEAADHLDRAGRFALGANISFGLGGAFLLAGTIWGLVDVAQVRRLRGSRPSASTEPARGRL